MGGQRVHVTQLLRRRLLEFLADVWQAVRLYILQPCPPPPSLFAFASQPYLFLLVPVLFLVQLLFPIFLVSLLPWTASFPVSLSPGSLCFHLDR